MCRCAPPRTKGGGRAGDRATIPGGGAAPALSSDVSESKRRGSWRCVRMNPVRDLLKSGKTVVGTAGSLSEDNMAMLADSGLDFILFDSQHAQTSPSLPFHQCGNKLTVLRT